MAGIRNVPEDDEPIGIRERERLQERRVDQAENHGIGANAQSERHGGGRGEARVAAKTAQPVQHITGERLDAEERIGFAGVLLDARSIAEPPDRRGPSLLGRQPPIDVRLDIQIDVRVDLLVELTIGPPPQPSSKAHGVSASVLRMRPTARTIFSHLLVSATSFARPARVSL